LGEPHAYDTTQRLDGMSSGERERRRAEGGNGMAGDSRVPCPGKVGGSSLIGPGLGSQPAEAGKRTLAEMQPVQRKAAVPEAPSARAPAEVAARGVGGSGQPLPYLDRIRSAFGNHDVTNVRTHVDGDAAAAARELGASAYTIGDRVAFAGGTPDLHTAAHEAAHVIQQRHGVQLDGGVDGGANDPHEQHADAVADKVVRGESAASLLAAPTGPTNDAAAEPTVQRKGAEEEGGGSSEATAERTAAPKPPVDPASKYTLRRSRDFNIHIGSVPAKVQFRLEASAKDKGDARKKVGKRAEVSWGASQKLIEKSADGVDAKITATVMQANLDLLAGGELPGPLAHLPPAKVEVKGLEAGLSLKDGAQLKLMTIALYTEGDLSKLFPDDMHTSFELKGSIRLEWALSPDLAKKMIELGRAADAIKRSGAVEAKIAKTEKWLAYYKTRGVKDEVKRLEGELSKLKKLRAGVTKARTAAIEKLVKVGAELNKSATGRFLKKASTKAFGVAFKKLLPIYNVVSTMQDLYEVGRWLAGLDWGNIGRRIIDGGQGGTTLGDGSYDGEEGTAGGGEGSGDGGPGDATDIDPDAIERELQQEANPELHATAQAVMGLLEHKDSDGPPIRLLAEDKETLNAVVPEDLSAEEIEALRGKIANASDGPRDLVERVIEAIQEVRPLGERRADLAETKNGGAGQDAAANAGAAVTKPQRDEPSELERWEQAIKPKPKPKSRQNPPGSQKPGTWIVDPADTLRKLITIDEKTRQPIVPDTVEFQGFTARVAVRGVAQMSFGTGGDGTESSFLVKVTIVPEHDAPGVMLVGGHRIKQDLSLPEIVVDGVRLRRTQ
jgi:hypothetical protein